MRGICNIIYIYKRYGNTPLHYAALYGHVVAVQLLITARADVNRVNM